MELSADGKFILLLADGKPTKVDAESGKAEPVKTSGEMVLNQADERSYIFDHAWRQFKEKFYVVDLQGVDWDFYYREYRKFLPYINNNYDFAEMLSEMLGEVNASHTGCRYSPVAEGADQTASLGLLYDFGLHRRRPQGGRGRRRRPARQGGVESQGRPHHREDRRAADHRGRGCLPAAEPEGQES